MSNLRYNDTDMKRNILSLGMWLLAASALLSACQNDDEMERSIANDTETKAVTKVTCSITTDGPGQLQRRVEADLQARGLGVSELTDLYVSGTINYLDLDYIKSESLQYLDSVSIKETVLMNNDSVEVNTLPEYCFYRAVLKAAIYLPSSLTAIADHCFAWGNVRAVYMDNVVSWGNYSFSNCSKLTHVSICNGLINLPDCSLEGLPNLKTVELPSTLRTIGYRVFFDSGLASLTIPASVKTIGGEAFRGTHLKEIVLPDAIDELGYNVFMQCESLESVTWPANMHTIPSGTFNGCKNLQFEIPDHITILDESAFYGCTKITQITLPAGVTTIKNSAFAYTGLTDLPAGLPNIPDYCFQGCNGLINIVIPNQITSIGSRAFMGCSNLQSVSFPSTLQNIGHNAFNSCSSLKEVTIPEGVTTIETELFANCSSLTTVTFPSSLTSVKPNLFSGCNNLYAVFWNSTLEVPDLMYDDNRNVLIYLPEDGSSSKYNDNLIFGNVAPTIYLKSSTDYVFKVPRAFKAAHIEYTRDYSDWHWADTYTGQNPPARWQSIVLPFTVQKVESEGKGLLAPFDAGVADAKPFWLRELTAEGYKDVTAIEANKPYILAMPNNPNYFAEYNIYDKVTFSADEVDIAVTSDNMTSATGPSNYNYALTGTFEPMPAHTLTFALNEESYRDRNDNNWPIGSIFVSNTRKAHSFEAVIRTTTALRYGQLPLESSRKSTKTRSVSGVPQKDDM